MRRGTYKRFEAPPYFFGDESPKVPFALENNPVMVGEAIRGALIVDFADSDLIVAKPGETARITTGGLDRCTAVGVVSERRDLREGYVQHYFPDEGDTAAAALADYLQGSRQDFETIRALIMVPEPSDDIDAEHRARLETTTQAILGEDNTQTVLYKRGTLIGCRMLIELLDDNSTKIWAEGRAVVPSGASLLERLSDLQALVFNGFVY